MTVTGKTQEDKARSDKFFWALVIILVCAAIGIDYYFNAIPWPLRLAGWIVLTCILIVIIYQTRQGKQTWKFAKEARIELRKITWPTRQITVRTTAIVACLVIITALILWGIDSILLFIIGWLTGQRG